MRFFFDPINDYYGYDPYRKCSVIANIIKDYPVKGLLQGHEKQIGIDFQEAFVKAREEKWKKRELEKTFVETEINFNLLMYKQITKNKKKQKSGKKRKST